jgi:hypothetical protein
VVAPFLSKCCRSLSLGTRRNRLRDALIFHGAVFKNAAMHGDSRRHVRRLVLIVFFAGASGCLPAGEAPKGRHIIADRSVNSAFFSPSGSDPARSHLLFGGPTWMSPAIESFGGSYSVMLSDLYQVEVPNTISQTLRLDQTEPAVRNLSGAGPELVANALPTDSRGRLLLQTIAIDPAGGATSILDRFDPDTRLMETLAEADAGSGTGFPTFSPGHTRALLYQPGSGALLIDLDAQQKFEGSNPVWVGEDLYYVVGERSNPWEVPVRSRMARLRPGAAPETMLDMDGAITIQLIGEDGPSLLMLRVQGPGTAPRSTYLFDPTTAGLVSLPFDTTNLSVDSLSPDGRWILLRSYSDGRLVLYDRIDGETRILPGDLQGNWQAVSEWRPGTDELWLATQPSFDPNGREYRSIFTIWTPDGSVTFDAMPITSCLGDVRYRSSVFNRAGSLWFSATWTSDISRMLVGWSDHPEEPPMPIAPDGTSVHRCWELEGHRLLVEAGPGDSQDTDLYLFDPSNREIRPLAGGSQVVQAGKDRALVLLQWERWRSAGELAIIDYATGQRTHLSDDVAQAVVDSRNADILSGPDPMAPGTNVAFISRNRLDSPYDGLWLTEVP